MPDSTTEYFVMKKILIASLTLFAAIPAHGEVAVLGSVAPPTRAWAGRATNMVRLAIRIFFITNTPWLNQAHEVKDMAGGCTVHANVFRGARHSNRHL